MTIAQFREKYNAANPDLPLQEYRAIDNRDDKSHLTRAASKISETLYASTALEQGTGKIKTLQITGAGAGPGYESGTDACHGLHDRATALFRARIVSGRGTQEAR